MARSGRPGGLLLGLPQALAIALSAPPVLLVAASACAGAGMSLFAVHWGVALQESTPDLLLGRVFSLDALLNSALMPVGIALTSRMLDLASPQAIATVASACLVATVLAVLPVPGVLHFADPEDTSAVDAPAAPSAASTPSCDH